MKSKYPRLRTHVRKSKTGKVWVWYAYDMRQEGKKDIPLGRDYAAALVQWERLRDHLPLTRGRVQEAIDDWREHVLPTYENAGTRQQYAKNLRTIEAWCGGMAWEEITLPMLRQYLKKRTAKTQGNREMSVLQIVWSHALMEGLTEKQWPAAGVKNWKNPESAREFEVTDALFNAVYECAGPMLRDAMDLATATGMRLTDVRTVVMPTDDRLHFGASKTRKRGEFVVSDSPVLTDLVKRRKDIDAHHLMLLSTPTGRPVSSGMLRDAYETARSAAAEKYPLLADAIKAMFLRDMRKRAADLSGDDIEASKLLQHSSVKVTKTHYRTKATQLKAVR